MKLKTHLLKLNFHLIAVSFLCIGTQSGSAQEICLPEITPLDQFSIRPNFGMAAIDDYDRDGHHDLNIGTAIYLGKGDGEFETPITLESFEGGFDARSADFDDDGMRDLAIIGIGASTLVLYWGKPKEGNSFLTRQSFPIPPSTGRDLWHMDIGDFNGDHLPDLAIASIGGNNHCVALNLGGRNFNFLPLRAPSLPLGHMVAVGDFTGDGRDDVAIGALLHVALMEGKGDGTFNTELPGKLRTDDGVNGGIGHRFRSGDLDGDGVDDLLCTLIVTDGPNANSVPSQVVIYLGSTLSEVDEFPSKCDMGLEMDRDQNLRFVDVADLNGDGNLDVAALAETPQGSKVRYFINDSQSETLKFIPGSIITTGIGGSSSVLTLGDLNGDRWIDIAVTSEDVNRARVFLSHCEERRAQLGDVNADDLIDVSDPISILSFLFLGINLECPNAGNVNGDDLFDLTDAIYLLGYLFIGGEPLVGESEVVCES